MDETEFWQIIDSARDAGAGDADEQAELVVEHLTRSDPEAVLDFARHFEIRFNRAFRWDLWAAAELMLGGADEDAFDAFRCWLIGQGRHIFEGALLHDPDDLAVLVEDFDPEVDGDAEDLGYAADEAYERLTGVPMPDLDLPEPPREPHGPPLDLRDRKALAERLPALWARFGD